jgi:type IV secretion system protein VirD4
MMCSHAGRDRWSPLRYGGPRHLVTVAPNRSGKGTCAIVPNLLILDHSVLVIDPKGENAAITARRREAFGKVHLLNPFNEHGLGTAHFNPLAHLSIDDPNVVGEVRGIAEALIVSEGNNPHFPNSARDLIQALILHLIETEPKKGEVATLAKMRFLLTAPRMQFLETIAAMGASDHGFVSNPAGRFAAGTDEIASVLSTAITQTSFLDDPAIARVLSGSDFSMIDLKDRPTSLYVILPSRYLVAYARFFRLLVVSAIDQLQSRPGGVKTTLMLDEFAALGHLSAIETAFGQAAGFNVQLWPFLQDLNQLEDIYKTRWESFIANAGVVQWFTPNDITTAEYLSKRLGQMTVQTVSTSTSTSTSPANRDTSTSSTSHGETGRPFQTIQDLMSLLPAASIITLSGLKHGIYATRFPYYTKPGNFSWEGPADEQFMAAVTHFWAQFQDYDRNPFHS